jgi:predicted ATP-grasp superfamily ATP-dependent carboligase
MVITNYYDIHIYLLLKTLNNKKPIYPEYIYNYPDEEIIIFCQHIQIYNNNIVKFINNQKSKKNDIILKITYNIDYYTKLQN